MKRDLALIVCGDRNWTDAAFIERVLDELNTQRTVGLVIEGKARGADIMAGAWADSRQRDHEVFPALWDQEGRAAGPKRNLRMLDRLLTFRKTHDLMVVGFHDHFAESRGTKHMITAARDAGVYAAVVGHDGGSPPPPEERKEPPVTTDAPFPSMKALREAILRDGYTAVHQATWARHRQALAGEPRPMRTTKKVEHMTLDELRATQNEELPSISDEAFTETGEGALSLSALLALDGDDSESLASLVPSDHWLREAFAETFESDLARAADLYAIFGSDDEMAVRYQTGRRIGYAGPPPATAERIRWEQYTAQCSDAKRSEHLSVIDGQVRYFHPERLTRSDYLARRDAYVANFKARHNITVLNERTFRQAIALKRDPKAEAIGRLLINDMIEQMERYERLTDDSFGSSREAPPENPYIPSYGLYLYMARKELGLEDGKWLPRAEFSHKAREASKIAYERWSAQRDLTIERWENDKLAHHNRHICRNSADHGSVDEMWHARLPQPEIDASLVTLGMAD